VADYSCGTAGVAKHGALPAEAGNGSQLTLGCVSFIPAGAVAGPSLEIAAIAPSQPVHDQSWAVHFLLNNNSVVRRPLLGWVEAIAYEATDTTKARAIHLKQSYPIADLQPDRIAEGDLVFTSTPPIGNGFVELTFFSISGGYTPGPRSADGVLPDVPAVVKFQLLGNGNAKALSGTAHDLTVVQSEAERVAAVFDFDTDGCYPSAAVSDQGVVNPGQEEQRFGIAWRCRDPAQLQTSRTYYRKATIRRNGTEFAVHMYALYFMKDKTSDAEVDALGHRHDWEFALVWTTNGAVTHASYSHHGTVTTDAASNLDRDAAGHVKFVYHHDGGLTHSMRFASKNEVAENDLGRFFTPDLMNWYTMTNNALDNRALRNLLDTHDFGQADCSFNDKNFPQEIAKSPPDGYPSGAQWKTNAMQP